MAHRSISDRERNEPLAWKAQSTCKSTCSPCARPQRVSPCPSLRLEEKEELPSVIAVPTVQSDVYSTSRSLESVFSRVNSNVVQLRKRSELNGYSMRNVDSRCIYIIYTVYSTVLPRVPNTNGMTNVTVTESALRSCPMCSLVS